MEYLLIFSATLLILSLIFICYNFFINVYQDEVIKEESIYETISGKAVRTGTCRFYKRTYKNGKVSYFEIEYR